MIVMVIPGPVTVMIRVAVSVGRTWPFADASRSNGMEHDIDFRQECCINSTLVK